MFENHSFMKLLNDRSILQQSLKLKSQRLRSSYSAIISGILIKNDYKTTSSVPCATRETQLLGSLIKP